MPQYPPDEKRIENLFSATQILSCTCQLFLMDGHKRKPHGCGILITCNEKYYLLSNSHVLNRAKFPAVYFLLHNLHPVLLEGGLMYSEKNHDVLGDNDTYDVAIMQLSKDVTPALLDHGFIFLELDTVQYSVRLVQGNITMIAAYPGSKMKIDPKSNVVKFNPLIVRTIPAKGEYGALGFPDAFHHVVEYPIRSFKESTVGQRMIAPSPHGMSGSGLWVLPGKDSFGCSPQLIGILSEYDERRALIFATKIDLYLSTIQQLFDLSLPYTGMKAHLLIN